MMDIPFNKPYMSGKELLNIAKAHFNLRLSGDGPFTIECQSFLESMTGTRRALLTHSCTAALEMAALLADVGPGDEVIMPSFTFVSTANAFVLRGAKPVFIDIRPDTLNMNESLIHEAINERTRAIVPVHYAGVACEMDSIMQAARERSVLVIEDAAQGFGSTYKGRSLGSMGDFGTLSFHETKNVISGEGGALLVNREDRVKRAEIVREKGTDRTQFSRGEIDKYTWQDVGSSFLPGELIAAFLHAQLEKAQEITQERVRIWNMYYEALRPLEWDGRLRRPIVPDECAHNGHLFYILVRDLDSRSKTIEELKKAGIGAVFHYVPLHDSPAGKRYCRQQGDMQVTNEISSRLIRLPIWIGMNREHVSRITDALSASL